MLSPSTARPLSLRTRSRGLLPIRHWHRARPFGLLPNQRRDRLADAASGPVPRGLGNSSRLRGDDIGIGPAIFFTDYSMAPTGLAVALEQRGFDSLWVAEHSHMRVTRRFTILSAKRR